VVEPLDIFPRLQYSRYRPNVRKLYQKRIYSTVMIGKTEGKIPIRKPKEADNIKTDLK
jgi:hypothetical protein